MTRKFLEEIGLDKNSVDRVLNEHSADIGKLKAEISELEKERGDFLEEINSLKIENAVDRSLIKAGARNLKAVKALIDMNRLSLLEDGTVLGLEEEIEKLIASEDTAFLFAKNSDEGFKGVRPFEKGNVKPDISCMTYSQYLAAGGQ